MQDREQEKSGVKGRPLKALSLVCFFLLVVMEVDAKAMFTFSTVYHWPAPPPQDIKSLHA